MESAWILRYELPDAFEEVMIMLCDRVQQHLEDANAAPVPAGYGAEETPGDEEESAI